MTNPSTEHLQGDGEDAVSLSSHRGQFSRQESSQTKGYVFMKIRRVFTQRRERLIYRFLVAALVAIIFILTVITIIRARRQESNDPSSSPTGGQATAHVGCQEDRIDGIVLCINETASTCELSSCFTCKHEIEPQFEPSPCNPKDEKNIKNGTCYLCGNTCVKYEEILDELNQGKESFKCPKSPKTVEIHCCLLEIMGNLAHSCGEGHGRYECYSKEKQRFFNASKTHLKPICRCPSDVKAKNCDKPYKQAARCNCFNSTWDFCDKDQIKECDNKITEDWTRCHKTVKKNKIQYNCLCYKQPDDAVITQSLCVQNT